MTDCTGGRTFNLPQPISTPNFNVILMENVITQITLTSRWLLKTNKQIYN